MTRARALVELREFEPRPSPGFAGWLAELDLALAFSHTNKVVSVGRRGAELSFSAAEFDRVTALALDGDDVAWIAAGDHLIRLVDALPPGGATETGATRLFVPRVTQLVGRAIVADVAMLADHRPIFCAVALSCLATLHASAQVAPFWAPPFVTALTPEMRCRLTGLCVRDGRPYAVAAASTSDTPDGWRIHQRDGGVVIDVASGEVVAAGLGLPHSPRWHAGRLWLACAASGEVGYLDGGDFVTVTRIDGFVRGLTLFDRWAVVAASGSRGDALVADLPVGERVRAAGRRPESGLFVIDTVAGSVAHTLRLAGTAREISDVVLHRGAAQVAYANPVSHEAQNLIAYEPGEIAGPEPTGLS